MANRKRYLVAYDIREDKRLRLVYKTMRGYGWRLQYSVFICDLDSIELIMMKSDLGEIIHHGSDSIAIIDLGSPNERGSDCFQFMGTNIALPDSGPIVV